MNNRFLYLTLFLFFTVNLFCQDMIIKKDSTKIEVKILEISQTEIKYKFFNYQDGPLYIVSKNDIAYFIYSNGIKEIFKDSQNETTSNDYTFINTAPPNGSYARPDSIGNYIKFNIQSAIVVYNSFSNVPRKNHSGRTFSKEYKYVSTTQNVTFNLGFNFLFGKSPCVKHVVGVNYLKTKSEFYYEHGSIGYSSYARYESDVDFVNIVTGLRFSVGKKLHLEPLITVNLIANSKTTRSGTATSVDMQTYIRHTTSFENEPTNTGVETTFAFTPKISYEIPIKKIKMEVYAAYNFAIQYRLPWYQFGVHIFPFKKLR